jgi:hypothetical protein
MFEPACRQTGPTWHVGCPDGYREASSESATPRCAASALASGARPEYLKSILLHLRQNIIHHVDLHFLNFNQLVLLVDDEVVDLFVEHSDLEFGF